MGESTLVKQKNIFVKYMNNKEAGVAYAVITGKKGYVGSVVKEFEITPAKSILRLKREIKAVTYNGKLQKPKVSVMAGSKTLKAGRDYTVSYANNVKVTSAKAATVTIKGKGSCKGNRKVSFIILPASLDVTQNEDLSINVADAAYNKGKAVKAAVTITDGSYQLKVNRD